MIFNLYSKRQKKLRGETPDVYVYDRFPHDLKVQIVHIIRDAIGKDINYGSKAEKAYEFLNKSLSREYGRFTLGNEYESNQEAILNFFLSEDDYEKLVDVIEICFQYIERVIKKDYEYAYYVTVEATPDAAIDELNKRFKEHAIGYQFESSEIIRVDSTLMHANVVLPTLNLLSSKKFNGANQEYLKAHEHYRHGRNKECLTDCLKAFESTLKIICKEKGWAYNETDTSKKLIQVCFTNSLVPTFTQNQFTSLQNLLESGIPTIRNKISGHGQGQIPQEVDDEMARYGLNLTGANIIFLIELSKL